MDEPTRFVTAPENVPNTLYDKNLFFRKLLELRVEGPFVGQVLDTLNDQFTLEAAQARHRRRHAARAGRATTRMSPSPRACSPWPSPTTRSASPPSRHISERVVFPSSPTEANGIEDARFVEFHDDDARSAITPPTPPLTAR